MVTQSVKLLVLRSLKKRCNWTDLSSISTRDIKGRKKSLPHHLCAEGRSKCTVWEADEKKWSWTQISHPPKYSTTLKITRIHPGTGTGSSGRRWTQPGKWRFRRRRRGSVGPPSWRRPSWRSRPTPAAAQRSTWRRWGSGRRRRTRCRRRNSWWRTCLWWSSLGRIRNAETWNISWSIDNCSLL